jgi:hypothetical protein
MTIRSPAELHDILKAMLRESLRLGAEGAQRSRQLHAQGCADGFMRALVECGISEDRELLALVREVRAELRGPATRDIDETTYAAA